jgi:hypothetical protein
VRLQEIAGSMCGDAGGPVGVVLTSILGNPLLILYDEVDGQSLIAYFVVPPDNYDGPTGVVVH